MQPLETNDPRVIGPYRLLGRIGAGGMGRVYLGRSPGGRTVAVKVVRPDLAGDTDFRARFRREVDAARRASGTTPALCARVLDADTDSPVPWIATGYVAGPSLADAVTEFGPLPLNGVRVLGAGLAEALTALHGMGLVHRDIKPSNVLLALDGPVLIDFGIARAMEATTSATGDGIVVGSPGYLAPEQVTGGRTGAASDVFSLGAVLVHAAAGHGPFRGESTAALLYKVVHEEPELDGVPVELRDVVEACLAKDPGVRPTPREITERLAPDGGAALVRGGWLSAPLTEQLGRHAVELLDLDIDVASLPSSPAGPGGTQGVPVPVPVPVPVAAAAVALRDGRRTGTRAGTRTVTLTRTRTAAAVGVGLLLVAGAAVAAWLLARQEGAGSSGDGMPAGPASPASATALAWEGHVFTEDGFPTAVPG